jgi:regulatory protein
MIERKKKRYTPGEGLKKAQAYCAYQERCQQEVRNKLYEWGLWPNDIEKIISDLITDNFLNEERFAKIYAGGKFRIKKWGRNRIILELKKRNISDYCVNRAMKELDENYQETLKKIILKKRQEIKEKNSLKKQYKIAQYAISRGFEPELVWDELKHLFS